MSKARSRGWQIIIMAIFSKKGFWNPKKGFSKKNEKVEKTLIQYHLKWHLLRCVTSDGCKNVWSRKRMRWTNWQSLLKHKVYGYSLYYLLAGILQKIFECIMCYWKNVINSVPFICTHRLNHHQFCEISSETKAGYPDILYHKILQRISSGGKVLL